MPSKKSLNNGNKITLEIGVPQKGNIKVHSQIINDLSSGIYSSPSSCVKELINNAYDADAQSVVIRVKPIEDSISIIDDGSGMNAVDFDNNFAWISKSNKRNNGELSPKLKRPLIGKIGIGFIAVNEICEELEITSTKEGEPIKFRVNINFKNYYQEETVAEDGIIKGAYSLINEEEDSKEHYTIIRLLKLKESVKNVLDDRLYLSEIVRSKHKDFDTVTFDSMKEILDLHTQKNLKSFSEDNAYIQFIIDLASYIPVEYIPGGPVEGFKRKTLSEIIKLHENLNFKVDLDGIYLKKPIYFPYKELSNVVEFHDEVNTGDDTIKFKGYFYIQHGLLVPRELNGVAIRIRNIPIAEQYGFDPTFMRYPNYMEQLFRNWVSGEIYIESGLEDAMNIDRKSFRITHPHYLALQSYLHHLLKNKVFKIAHDEIYEVAKEERTEEQKKITTDKKKKILKTKAVTYTKKTADKKPKVAQVNKNEIKAPIKILKSSSQNTIVELDEAEIKKFKKKDWEVLENVFLIFELAYKESKGDINSLRSLFYHKINEWKDIK
ncbi:ATP-binding protein [Chitinophaga sp. YIM B06452]|uniref:ATP-binding protein n=1 Tax=Chitinophaga sp. YIM B06452 TaxID=3082158 RepID=UPI0031FE87DB